MKKPSTFEKCESSSQNHNSAIQKNLGQKNLIQNNLVRETIPSQRLTSDLMELVKRFQSKRYHPSTTQRKLNHKLINKQPIFDIYKGAPSDSSNHLQDSLNQNKMDTNSKMFLNVKTRAPLIPKKVWQKKVQSNVVQCQSNIDQVPQNPKHDLNQLHVSFPCHM